jgi:hypothetical protein
MPWCTLKAPPTTEVDVTHEGEPHVATFRGNEAYLPLSVVDCLVRDGVAIPSDKPNPAPRFERLAGAHGQLLDPYGPYLRKKVGP